MALAFSEPVDRQVKISGKRLWLEYFILSVRTRPVALASVFFVNVCDLLIHAPKQTECVGLVMIQSQQLNCSLLKRSVSVQSAGLDDGKDIDKVKILLLLVLFLIQKQRQTKETTVLKRPAAH